MIPVNDLMTWNTLWLVIKEQRKNLTTLFWLWKVRSTQYFETLVLEQSFTKDKSAVICVRSSDQVSLILFYHTPLHRTLKYPRAHNDKCRDLPLLQSWPVQLCPVRLRRGAFSSPNECAGGAPRGLCSPLIRHLLPVLGAEELPPGESLPHHLSPPQPPYLPTTTGLITGQRCPNVILMALFRTLCVMFPNPHLRRKSSFNVYNQISQPNIKCWQDKYWYDIDVLCVLKFRWSHLSQPLLLDTQVQCAGKTEHKTVQPIDNCTLLKVV